MKFQNANVVTKDGAVSVVINYLDNEGVSQSAWFNNCNDVQAAVNSFVALKNAGLL